MNFSKTNVVLILAFAVIVAGCKSKDKKRASEQISYDQLYFDYSITAEDESENVTCVFQYKDGGEEGKAVDIAPAKVELDGRLIETDSTKLSGFFFEVQKPLDSFTGKHSVVFITPDKRYANDFAFTPFGLENEMPEKVRRKPFIIQLKNFPAREKSLRLLLLDTAFASSGFNDLVPVIDGKINIDQTILSTIKNGPVNLELYMEQELPLKQKTLAGGKIYITYGLKREFELVD